MITILIKPIAINASADKQSNNKVSGAKVSKIYSSTLYKARSILIDLANTPLQSLKNIVEKHPEVPEPTIRYWFKVLVKNGTVERTRERGTREAAPLYSVAAKHLKQYQK